MKRVDDIDRDIRFPGCPSLPDHGTGDTDEKLRNSRSLTKPMWGLDDRIGAAKNGFTGEAVAKAKKLNKLG